MENWGDDKETDKVDKKTKEKHYEVTRVIQGTPCIYIRLPA